MCGAGSPAWRAEHNLDREREFKMVLVESSNSIVIFLSST
jgi:hypothetical protein